MADKMAARQFVIDVARYFVACHYVWGSAGARPGARRFAPSSRHGLHGATFHDFLVPLPELRVLRWVG